ncbi:MAG TPA: GIY-YIG nuclease family protein [Methanosarcina sp.]|nr:GIY-YIG nuclease family protein [Methanosarcina sp.]
MYYVYILIDPRTMLPFYAGKGKGKRAQYHTRQNQKGKNTENPYKDHVIRQILSEGLVPIIEYIFQSEDEKVAYDFEETTIQKYGRRRYDHNGILTNLCKDSRPPNQRGEYTEERKQKYRERMLGNTLNVGRTQSQEEKDKRAQSLKESYESGKRVVTDKMRDATRKTHSGKTVSRETRQKQSDSAKLSKAWRVGKTNEEIFGTEKAKEIMEKKSKLPPPNRKPITINGIVYQSIKEASIALDISEYKAKKLSDYKKI